jgi:putative SOS response-associated peptidase YedK
MCGRYHVETEEENIQMREIMAELNRRRLSVKTGEIAPGANAPVLLMEDGKMHADAMRWGARGVSGMVINARSETAADRPLFRDGMRQRRCAVPATRYFEWERTGGKRTKYAIRPERGGLFYFAGLYRMLSGRPEFVILTRQSADSIAFIHDRMPVILPSELVADWTNPRYDAGEILGHAVLAVTHEKAQVDGQLEMVFP